MRRPERWVGTRSCQVSGAFIRAWIIFCVRWKLLENFKEGSGMLRPGFLHDNCASWADQFRGER